MPSQISMICTNKMALIMNELKIEGNPFKLIPLYESGMIEVLKDLAAMSWLDMEDIHDSAETLAALEVSAKSQEQFQLTLKDNEESFNEMESDMNRVMLCSNFDHYVIGFIEGYRFLKSKMSSTELGKG